MASNKVLQCLIDRWRELKTRGGQLDFDYATFARDAQAVYPVWDQFWEFFSETLGERETSVVKKFARMAEVVGVVTDPAVWRAVGWREVQHVARIEDAKKREAACAGIVAETAKRPKVGPKVVDKILAEEAPETFLPKPPVPETKKDREQTRMAREALANAAPPKPSAAERDRDVLRAALKRLIGGGYPFLADLLTPEERRAAGLGAERRKGRAS